MTTHRMVGSKPKPLAVNRNNENVGRKIDESVEPPHETASLREFVVFYERIYGDGLARRILLNG